MADFSASVQQPIGSPPADVNLNDTGDSLLKPLDDFMDRMGVKHLGYLYNYWNQVLAANHQAP
ncbi:MAG TPA: hypothetical protein VHZ97_04325, partial [Pseudonocardiaceae bacterium]|nr:hypothetical protein [Pseudonocardiaceae bacterium]